jgi:hypothetical protein
MLEVTEAWRLPTLDKPVRHGRADEKDYEGLEYVGAGRHVIVCGKVVLLDEPWEIKRFPFVQFQWESAGRHWGVGMVERGAGMQSDLNELTEIIQETYRVFVPQLWIDENAGIEATSLNDLVGKVNRFRGGGVPIDQLIKIISGDVSSGLLSRESMIQQRFLPSLGVDMLGAEGKKPAGVDSGTALREYSSLTSQRFIVQQRRYERAGAVDLAVLLFHFAERLAKSGSPQRVYGGKLGLQLVDLGELLEQTHEDEIYRVEIKPGSALPRDIAGKISTVLDLKAAGLPMDPVELAEMLEMPDTDAMLSRIAAGRELVRNAVDACSKLDEPQPAAHAFWPRQWALGELTTQIQLAEVNGADEEVLDRLRNLHGHLRSLPDPNAPPPAPPGAPPMGPPGAPPMLGAAPMPLDPAAAMGGAPMPALPPGAPPM